MKKKAATKVSENEMNLWELLKHIEPNREKKQTYDVCQRKTKFANKNKLLVTFRNYSWGKVATSLGFIALLFNMNAFLSIKHTHTHNKNNNNKYVDIQFVRSVTSLIISYLTLFLRFCLPKKNENIVRCFHLS